MILFASLLVKIEQARNLTRLYRSRLRGIEPRMDGETGLRSALS